MNETELEHIIYEEELSLEELLIVKERIKEFNLDDFTVNYVEEMILDEKGLLDDPLFDKLDTYIASLPMETLKQALDNNGNDEIIQKAINTKIKREHEKKEEQAIATKESKMIHKSFRNLFLSFVFWPKKKKKE